MPQKYASALRLNAYLCCILVQVGYVFWILVMTMYFLQLFPKFSLLRTMFNRRIVPEQTVIFFCWFLEPKTNLSRQNLQFRMSMTLTESLKSALGGSEGGSTANRFTKKKKESKPLWTNIFLLLHIYYHHVIIIKPLPPKFKYKLYLA